MEIQKELLTLPFYYDEGSQMILDQRGIVLDVRMWGRITGTGGMNLPSSEAMKIQDDFGKRVVEILNSSFSPPKTATEDKKAPVEQALEEILDKHGAGIYNWNDSYVFKEGSNTREAALKAMQEYASLCVDQALKKTT